MPQFSKRPLFLLLILVTLAPSAAVLASWADLPFLAKLTQNRLAGATEWVRPPPRKLPAFWAGQFQERFGPWIASQMGKPRELYLRWNNGIGYAVGRSYASQVYIGRERTLYESGYVRDWCSHPPDDSRDVELAQQISQLHQRVTASGRRFLLVFSPSKAAIYPEFVKRACGETNGNRHFNQLKAALEPYRVPTVDTSRLLREARTKEPLPFFGRDGMHWNQLGASLAVRGIFDAIGDLSGRPTKTLSIERLTVSDRPSIGDQDLGTTLNLPFKLRPYPSLHATFKTEGEGYRPRILIVGTSFTWEILDQIAKGDLSEETKFYFYFSKIARVADREVKVEEASFAAKADFPQAFERSEVVILEINESNVLSTHTTRFAGALADHLGLAPVRKPRQKPKRS